VKKKQVLPLSLIPLERGDFYAKRGTTQGTAGKNGPDV
jgi:hypothetical protein